MKNGPSNLAMAFFHWFCRPELKEEIEGDLLERFHYYHEKYGYVKANHIFIKDVILLFRPGIIGNLNQLINTNTMILTKPTKRLITILAVAMGILIIPLVSMNFSPEVNWKFFDFLVAGFLLVGTGLTLELILRRVQLKRNRVLLGIALFVSLLLIWAELAVGIFGTVIAGS